MWALIAVIALVCGIFAAVGFLRVLFKIVLLMPVAFITAMIIVFLLAFAGGWRP